MKAKNLIVGIIIGSIISFFITKAIYQANPSPSPHSSQQASGDSTHSAASWTWPDSLDAVKIAPNSHHIVYEDSTVRILQVILEPGKTEPVHTHQWRSVMWFTDATPMTYYKFASANNQLLVEDSFQIPQMPAEVLNRGDTLVAEGPHAIRNTGTKPGVAYRVEFKKKFLP